MRGDDDDFHVGKPVAGVEFGDDAVAAVVPVADDDVLANVLGHVDFQVVFHKVGRNASGGRGDQTDPHDENQNGDEFAAGRLGFVIAEPGKKVDDNLPDRVPAAGFGFRGASALKGVKQRGHEADEQHERGQDSGCVEQLGVSAAFANIGSAPSRVPFAVACHGKG